MHAPHRTLDDSPLAILSGTVDASYPRLLAHARRLSARYRTPAIEPEELVSEAYLGAHTWIESRRPEIDPQRLEGLLVKIMDHRLTDACRAASRRAAAERSLEEAALPPAPAASAHPAVVGWGRPLAALRGALGDGDVAVSRRQLAALVGALERRQADGRARPRDAAERQNASRAARALMGWLRSRSLSPGQRAWLDRLDRSGRRPDAVAQLHAMGALPFLRALVRDHPPERAA
jgi:DNA-directed RNA polymerase specialized sigma24 family protein